MKTRFVHLLVALFFLCWGSSVLATAFMYSGNLNQNGVPANGTYDVETTLYGQVSDGVPLAGPFTNFDVTASNGQFTILVDFGDAYDGSPRWLEIGVQTNSGGGFTTLTPRQQIVAVPYAIFALATSNLLGTLSSTQISGTLPLSTLPGAVLTNGQAGVVLNGTFQGSAALLTNLNASQLTSGSIRNALMPVYLQNPPPLTVGAETMRLLAQGSNSVWLLLGDSMTDWGGEWNPDGGPGHWGASEAATRLLQNNFGNSGVGWMTMDSSYNQPVKARPELGSAGNWPMWMGFPAAIYASDQPWGARAVQGVGGCPKVPVNQLQVYWVANTNGGQVTVFCTNAFTKWSETWVLPGVANTMTLSVTNLSLPLDQNYEVYFGSTATNVLLSPAFLNTNGPGIVKYCYQAGGTTINDMLSIGTENFSNLCQAAHPNVIVWHSKHFDSGNNASNLVEVLSLARGWNTNCLVVLVGTPPPVPGLVYYQNTWVDPNTLMRDLVGSGNFTNWFYLDLFGAFPNITNNCAAGMMDSWVPGLDFYFVPGTALHPSAAGAWAWGAEMVRQMGLQFPPTPPVPTTFNQSVFFDRDISVMGTMNGNGGGISNVTASALSTSSTNTPPANASAVKGWLNINAGGQTYKLPLYQ